MAAVIFNHLQHRQTVGTKYDFRQPSLRWSSTEATLMTPFFWKARRHVTITEAFSKCSNEGYQNFAQPPDTTPLGNRITTVKVQSCLSLSELNFFL
jgi:hypothetical protein